MITLERYSEEYDEALRELSKLSQKGDITFSIFREPRFYSGAQIQTQEVLLYLILKEGELIGVFNMGSKLLTYKGKREKVRYLCDVKVKPEYQNGSSLFKVVAKTYEIMEKDTVPTQLIMFAENHRILKLVKGRKKKRRDLKIFHGHEVGKVKTTLIDRKNRVKKSNSLELSKARIEDVQQLQEFIDQESLEIDFFPYYDLSKLGTPYYRDLKIEDFYIARSKGKIVGTFAIWDLTRVKQTVIMGYSRKYHLARPFYNMWAGLKGTAKLGKVGEKMVNKYISCLLVVDRNAGIYRDLLSFALEDMKKEEYHYLLSTLDIRDPLDRVHQEMRYRREIWGEFHLGDMEPEDGEYVSGAYFYLEAARI